MKQRLVMLALAAGCLVLAVAGALVCLGQDRKAPEITVEDTEISYTEGGDYEELLEGVTAEDNIDGDLTDQVFVDKIIQTGEDTGIVYYGVMDKHHNVGTARRTITYHLSENGDEAVTEQTEETEEADGEEEEAASQEQAAQTEPKEEETLQPDGTRPALALTATETTIAVGTAFDPMSVVKDAVDDVDTKDSLPGTYTIQYFVTDSSGNTSDPQNFTLKVQ
mgnify:CR=1 FL=1